MRTCETIKGVFLPVAGFCSDGGRGSLNVLISFSSGIWKPVLLLRSWERSFAISFQIISQHFYTETNQVLHALVSCGTLFSWQKLELTI